MLLFANMLGRSIVAVCFTHRFQPEYEFATDRMQPQAAFMMAPDKKSLLAGLQAAVPDWYDPTTLWKTFPAAAHRVSPSGVQATANSPHPAPMTQPAPEAVND